MLVGVVVGLGIAAEAVRVTGVQFPGREGVVVLLGLDSEFNVPTVADVPT